MQISVVANVLQASCTNLSVKYILPPEAPLDHGEVL